jgi:hypothetical protein
MEVKVRTIILSYLNDFAIDHDPLRLEFVKYLVFSYTDTSVEINPTTVWRTWYDSRQK